MKQRRKKKKRIKRNEDNLRDLWNNVKRPKIRIILVPEEDTKKDHDKILEEIIVENFPKIGKEIITQVPETLCFLIGEFNPFILRAIIYT